MEDSVKWRLFDEAVSELRDAFADVPAGELHNLIEEALASARRNTGLPQNRFKEPS